MFVGFSCFAFQIWFLQAKPLFAKDLSRCITNTLRVLPHLAHGSRSIDFRDFCFLETQPAKTSETMAEASGRDPSHVPEVVDNI